MPRLLRRLKYASPGHRQVSRLTQSNRRPQQNRGMGVVTASVHHSGFRRSVVNAVLFMNRQSIDICSQGNCRCVWPTGKRFGNDPFPFLRDSMGDLFLVKALGQKPGGFGLLAAEFGISMQYCACERRDWRELFQGWCTAGARANSFGCVHLMQATNHSLNFLEGFRQCRT